MKAHAWVVDWEVARLYLNQVQPISGLIKSNLIQMASAYSGFDMTMFKHVHITAGGNIIKKGKSPFKK